MANRGNLYYWVANWNLSRAQAAVLLRGEVASLVDCIHGNVGAVKEAYYDKGVRRFGGYVTGTPDIRWTTEDFDSFPGSTIWRIDQSNLDLALLSDAKRIVADQEPGAKTIPQTVEVARQRIVRGDNYTVYVDQADLVEVEHAIAAAGLPHGLIIAYQYESTDIADLSVVSTSKMPLPGVAEPTTEQQRLDIIEAELDRLTKQ